MPFGKDSQQAAQRSHLYLNCCSAVFFRGFPLRPWGRAINMPVEMLGWNPFVISTRGFLSRQSYPRQTQPGEKWFLPRLLTWHSSEKTLPWKLLHSILPIKNFRKCQSISKLSLGSTPTSRIPVTNEGLPRSVVAWQQKRRAPNATGGCQHLGDRFFHDLQPLLITQHHPNVPPLETNGLIRLFKRGVGWWAIIFGDQQLQLELLAARFSFDSQISYKLVGYLGGG